MSSEQSSPESENGEGSELATDLRQRMETFYREYVGEPAQERDIYLGFGLFFAGMALAAIGFVIFLYSNTQPQGSPFYWQLREIALVGGILGLPVALQSIIVLLPVGKRTRAVGIAGSAFCVIAAGILVSFYPYNWSIDGAIDGSVMTISVYAVGIVALASSTGSALVAQYLDKATQAKSVAESDDDTDSGESVSDDEVASDIESAMDDTELSWGGVDHQPSTKRLKLDMPDAETGVEQETLDNAEATTTRSESETVDDAVSGLRSLQGGESKTTTASSPDDQVNALTEFREQKAEDDEVETGVDQSVGILERVRTWFHQRLNNDGE